MPVALGLVLVGLLIAAQAGREVRRRRDVAIGLVLAAIVVNLTSLGLLTHYLLGGGRASGEGLIGGGAIIWTTNLLLFAVVFWELDRGGPRRPGTRAVVTRPDFLFPAMDEDRWVAPGWMPDFGDYLYVSLTNQTAFSPTDTMPLTARAKLLMGVQGLAALVTIGVIIARAVNILGS